MQNSEENTSEKKRKIFVLDTSVIISDWECISKLGQNDIIIPIVVIEELDNIKKDEKKSDDVRHAARKFLRIMADYKVGAEFEDSLPFPTGARVKIDSAPIQWTAKLKQKLDSKKNDNNIVLVALRISQDKENNKGKREVVLISQDINMQVKAQAFRVKAEDFLSGEAKIEEGYTGIQHITPEDIFKKISSDEAKDLLQKKFLEDIKEKSFTPNETIIVPFDGDKRVYAVVKQKSEKDIVSQELEWVEIEKEMNRSYCSPKNIEQAIAFNYLVDPNIQIVTMTGKAGTGKTLLALMAGWQGLGTRYDKIKVYRPYVEVGQSIGYLPGDLDEKMLPFKQPIYDNFKVLFENPWVNKKVRPSKKNWQQMTEKERECEIVSLEKELFLSIHPLGYTRGINLRRAFVILDEPQNATHHQVKTLITRLGEGSKIVLAGDLTQIDHPYLTPRSNGFAHVIANFKGQSMYAHIHLKKNERSSLSDIAAEIL